MVQTAFSIFRNACSIVTLYVVLLPWISWITVVGRVNAVIKKHEKLGVTLFLMSCVGVIIAVASVAT